MPKIKKQKKDFHISSWKAWKNIEKYFKFDNLGATMKKEIIGGITTFLAMIYILSVEPAILSGSGSVTGDGTTMNYFGIFLGVCIASFASTFVMGLFANVPLALAPSMGVNVMFAVNIAGGTGANGHPPTIIGYEGALIATMISSIFFLIFSITPLRKIIINAIPEQLMIAIGVGIGFFIAYVGLSSIGWVAHTETGLPVADLGRLKDNYPQILLGTGLFLIMLLFMFMKVNGGVAICILIGTVIALIVANAGPNLAVSKEGGIFYNANFVDGGGKWEYDFNGFASNIKNTWKEFTNVEIWNKPTMYISIFILMFLNFFDATGTITTVNRQLNEAAGTDRPLSHEALIIDSGATVVGSAVGVSPMGVYVESGAGIAQGARTGFASIITSVFFLISIALFPIFKAVPGCVTGAATLFVGVMMMGSIKDLDWKKPEIAISAFFAILFMVVTYSIANGIGVLIILYVLIKTFKKEVKEVPITLWIVSLIFIAYFIAYAFIQL
ncbi:NCS2 family permease [Mesoplasma lactucae]|nr:NCS2 family permease [Mesoplasma lactucae]